MSRQDLAERVGRPLSVVYDWEAGKIEFGVDRVYELEEMFGLPHGALLVEAGYVDAEALFGCTGPGTA